MPMSEYIRRLRQKVGNDLLLMPSVAVVVFDPGSRVLLIRHSEGDRWVFPGGSVDPLETPADAAVREMWEETGFLVEPIRVLGVYGGPDFQVTYSNGDRVGYVSTLFECRLIGGEARPDGLEVLEMSWFSEVEVGALGLSTLARAVLPDVLGHRGDCSFDPPTWRPPKG